MSALEAGTVRLLHSLAEWCLVLLRTAPVNRRSKPIGYREAELRAKELQTIAFFMIVSYFALLAEAVFN
ncbi:hypothetical protein [Bradyrhizobium manausense]|uniref:Uncharacterized protein n=1 Tax=Bradyrhizobium manausense TaxID=989370 RepID=A0A0R3DSD1_9BRAD|nr:hypothetical protein [Bradyrhizobium manausense]KRQ12651.1 hypothetical protein AOQ71_16020 [Bradyrhizobium manausense]